MGDLQQAPHISNSNPFICSSSPSPPHHPLCSIISLSLFIFFSPRVSHFLQQILIPGKVSIEWNKIKSWTAVEGKTLTSSPPFWSVFHFSVSLSWLFSPLGAPLFSLSRVPPSLPDCNNSNNDNNGDGPGDGDVKKHNIRITNTLSNQWPSFDLCGCECVRTLCAHSLELLKTQICVCERAGEKRRDRERQ